METILVVDDESMVRKLVCDALKHRGFETFEAADAKEALGLFEAFGPAIDFVITDIQMPSMNGCELAAMLVAARPRLPVLLISGCIPEGPAGVKFPFLPKPFTPKVLVDRVQQIMAARV